MAIKIPENTLPIRDVLEGDYVRVVGQDGKSYRVPKSGFGEDVTEALNNKADIIITSASGSIAHFEDGAAYDAVEVVAHIEPVQAGSGDPSPDNVRPIYGHTGCEIEVKGVNVWDEVTSEGAVQSDGSVTDANRLVTSYIPIIPGYKYAFHINDSSRGRGAFYDSNKGFLSYYGDFPNTTNASVFPDSGNIYSISDGYYFEFIAPTNAYYLRYTFVTAYGTTYNHDASVNYPSTYTAYHAYDGTTYPITWQTEAGTVYGGLLEEPEGILKVYPYYESYNGETLVGPWVSSMDKYVEGTSPTTGAQVVDLGGAQTEYQLTPTQIDLLKGKNNVWNDCGNTDVTYKADTKLYIDNKITEAIANALNA